MVDCFVGNYIGTVAGCEKKSLVSWRSGVAEEPPEENEKRAAKIRLASTCNINWISKRPPSLGVGIVRVN